jgi:hypothetical protein
MRCSVFTPVLALKSVFLYLDLTLFTDQLWPLWQRYLQ